ncbi:MAG: hypothetical protein AB7O66_23820 [Limisphaerales bacterium]
MSEGNTPRLNRLPFWFADGTLLVTAAFLALNSKAALGAWEMLAIVVCVGLGGWLAVLPVLKEYEVTVEAAETDQLAATMEKLTDLDVLADRIAAATSQWQGVQDRAAQTAESARGVVDRLAREAEAFATAVSRSADAEKQTLKLEVDKLRRAEGEWLQAVGRVMDHVFALHLAAVKSAQPAVAEQIDRFHAACRDALRRVGFIPVVAAPDELFDPRKHQVADGPRPAEGARIDETVAAGYLYQGQVLRPVIVRVAAAAPRGTPAVGSGGPISHPDEGPADGDAPDDAGAADRGGNAS